MKGYPNYSSLQNENSAWTKSACPFHNIHITMKYTVVSSVPGSDLIVSVSRTDIARFYQSNLF
jgi:hypothetical protein